jgi:hypothetical protein
VEVQLLANDGVTYNKREPLVVSGVFGASPKIALKKRTSVPPCGMVEAGAAEGR